MTDIAVCLGFHRATKELRDGHMESIREAGDAKLSGEELRYEIRESTPQSPLFWATYIHFGV